jgi:hypothetical protein
MKTIINLLAIVLITGLSNCIVDEPGPEGPQGPQGEKGDSGFVFEWEEVSFTSPDYEVFLPFPDDFETLSSDVALVYFLWEVVDIDGVSTEVWRQIPQTILTENGLLQYNFDFSMVDIRLFLEAEFDMSLLGAIDTDDWVVRVVVVPGDFWNSARVNSNDISYEEAVEMFGLPKLDARTSSTARRK